MTVVALIVITPFDKACRLERSDKQTARIDMRMMVIRTLERIKEGQGNIPQGAEKHSVWCTAMKIITKARWLE